MNNTPKTTTLPLIRIVVAVSENGVIGKDNTLIWWLPADLQWFKKNTIGFPVIMGRKTFESIGRPLPNRKNIILTRDISYTQEGIEVVRSVEEALSICSGEERVSVIGGGEIYRMFLPTADELYLTKVHASFDGDTFFPLPGNEWRLILEERHDSDEKNNVPYSFMVYKR